VAYNVGDGYLQVTCEDDERGPDLDDPSLIAGRCLLALLAAGFGAIAGPIVAGPPARSAVSPGETDDG
jgi:hypothetical protein